MRVSPQNLLVSNDSSSNNPAPVPDSPLELLRMQNTSTENVNKVVELIDDLVLEPLEMLDLSRRLIEWLEIYHTDQMSAIQSGSIREIDLQCLCEWAIDRDRLRTIILILDEVVV